MVTCSRAVRVRSAWIVAAALSLGPARARAIVEEGVIRRVLALHAADTRACYERARAADPTLRGRVAVRFTLTPDGKVTGVEVADADAGLAAVATCVAGVVATLQFPTMRSGLTVTYPFVFAPSSARRPSGPPRIRVQPATVD